MTTVIISFIFFLAAFVVIGVSSMRARKGTADDYLLADRSVPPWLAALSAVATNNSGFMFIGQIAYTYRVGIESVWMMIGWIVGDLIAWQVVHPRVRRESEKIEVATVPALLGTTRDGEKRIIIVLAGLMTFVLLGVYAAAQLKAGSTALQTLFGWEPQVGAVIGAVIVVLYCFSGGIRASIWTDAAQSIVMILAMAILLIAASFEIGSPVDVWSNLNAQDPELVTWFPNDLKFGFALYLLGMAFGGFGAIGQPHILVRFMAIRSVEGVQRAKWIYFLWFIPFFVASIAVGLYARAYMPDLTSIPLTEGLTEFQATELAMPEMARRLLPDADLDRAHASGVVFSYDVNRRFANPCLLRCDNPGHQSGLEKLIFRFQARHACRNRHRFVHRTFCWPRCLLSCFDCLVGTWSWSRSRVDAKATRHPAFFIGYHSNDDGRSWGGHCLECYRLGRRCV
ncbi:MAG: sodium/proline symporter [Rubripirellula sp.]|nr:sodium/proline symporter [Rubripirellula sp.]